MQRTITVDLQTHSHFSDGSVSPAEVARRAAGAGLKTLALTDHSTVDGWPEFSRACTTHGIVAIRAVEISCRFAHGWLDLLAYGLDASCPAVQAVLAQSQIAQNQMVDSPIAWLAKRTAGPTAETIRRHFGIPFTVRMPYWLKRYLREVWGYSAERVKDVMQLCHAELGSRDDIFSAHLPTAESAIAAVHESGGIISIAHAHQSARILFRQMFDPADRVSRFLDEIVAPLVKLGADAIEVSHWSHDAQTERMVRDWVNRSRPRLLKTGGSNYHGDGPGENKPDVPFGRWGLTAEEFAPVAERLGVR